MITARVRTQLSEDVGVVGIPGGVGEGGSAPQHTTAAHLQLAVTGDVVCTTAEAGGDGELMCYNVYTAILHLWHLLM